MDKLQWDSVFWGIDIFHLDKFEDFNLNQVTSIPSLVQALPDISDMPFINNLELNGFNFKQSKVTLEKSNIGIVTLENCNFEKTTSVDLKTYKNIFFELFGENTRYDTFPRAKVNEFYYTWLLNSIEGTMDDTCIGYFDGDKLAGFVTYRIRDSIITIGLLGVLPEFQGRGISQLLLKHVDDVAFKNAINTIRISTQAKNLNALNAYIKNGYRIYSVESWYYFTKGVRKYDSI